MLAALEEAIADAELAAARRHLDLVGTGRPVVGHAGARQHLVEERVVMLRAARRLLPAPRRRRLTADGPGGPPMSTTAPHRHPRHRALAEFDRLIAQAEEARARSIAGAVAEAAAVARRLG